MANTVIGNRKLPKRLTKNLVQPGMRLGSLIEKVNPHYPGQLGASFGKHANLGDTRKTAAVQRSMGPAALPTPFGNEVAAKTECRVGGSRTIYKSGFQSQHGPAVPGNPPHQRKSFD